eukprot:Phypoly_transcript_08343.p1 GENE.Phypoly_transcript_08343~~Phypoly_transcript_08343.p1  ORF type:complete len:189 (+),score=57.64 Phypoly_transcript_08343:807-1373(+)
MLGTPPNAAARAASPRSLSPSPVPMYATPPKSPMRAASPRVEIPPSGMAYTPPISPHARAYSPPVSPHERAYSPPASPHARAYSPPTSPNGYAPVPVMMPRVASPNPAQQQAPAQGMVIDADEFDLRFAVRERTESISDDTALGADFQRDRWNSISEDVDMIDDAETTNQKGKSGLFSFGKNTPKKLK